jgi:hypothetical protein
MTVLAVAGVQDEADRLALGVAASQGDDAGSVGLRPGLLRRHEAALPGPFVEVGEHQVGPVDLVAGGAEVLPDRAEGGAPAGAVFDEPDGLRPVRVGAGAGVDAQLGLQRRGDLPGADEADQAAREDRWLRAGGQPDGQPPGGDVIDAAAAAVGGVDAVADETLVQGQVRQQPVLRQLPGVSRAAACRSGCGIWLAGQSAASLSGCPLARSC